MQNDLDNPDRKVYKGDKFGYNYYIRNINTRAWLQNQIVTRHWNVNYAAEFSYTNFWRHGMMRNGRAPGGVDDEGNPLPMSKGKGKNHEFFNFGVKAGATYKLDGRNYFTGHVGYGTRARRWAIPRASVTLRPIWGTPGTTRISADHSPVSTPACGTA